MKFSKLAFTLVSASFLFSCTNSEHGSGEAVLKDSSTIAQVSPLLDLFKTENSLPFSADTTLFYTIENCDSLGTREVKQLDKEWFMPDPTAERDYDLEQFYKIDSIKASGTYASWCDSLEPGNTKSANAYAICKLKADEKTNILVWGLKVMSYEACPYAVTSLVYITILKDGAVTHSFALGEYFSAGDPPASLVRTRSGKINKDLTITRDMYEIGDEDMDQPEVTETREHHEFVIKDGKISLTKADKKPPVQVKRKK